MRRGRGEEAGESLGRAKSSASWGGGGGAAGLQMTRSQAVVAGEHAVVAGHVEAGRRNQCAEAGEELLRVHVGVGGAAAPGSLEGDADAAVGERSDGVMGEGRAQHARVGDAAAYPLTRA